MTSMREILSAKSAQAWKLQLDRLGKGGSESDPSQTHILLVSQTLQRFSVIATISVRVQDHAAISL
jgi:hypothetical protein